MPKKQITVDFSEIFEFAEKKFNMGWNECYDLFHRNTDLIIDDEGHNKEISSSECEGNIKWLNENKDNKYYSEDLVKANEVILAFMKKEKIKEMLVLND